MDVLSILEIILIKRKEKKELKKIGQNLVFLKKRYNYFFIDQIAKIKLPRYKNDCIAKYFTLGEIENDKFTTLEKLNHGENLDYEISKKLRKIRGE